MRRLPRLAAVVLMVAAASCATMRDVPRSDLGDPHAPVTRFTRFARPGGQRVAGYRTTDGRFHRLYGTAWLEPDTMVFHQAAVTPTGVTAGEPERTVRVALADLRSVASTSAGPVQTTIAVGLAAGLLGMMAIGILVGSIGD